MAEDDEAPDTPADDEDAGGIDSFVLELRGDSIVLGGELVQLIPCTGALPVSR